MDKGLRYECLECDWVEIVSVSDHRLDGRSCKRGGGHIVPTEYVLIGVDLASGPDRTAYIPPIKKLGGVEGRPKWMDFFVTRRSLHEGV